MATRHKWNLILAYACMLGATTSFLITPKFIGKAVDKIAASYNDGIIPTSLMIETVIAIVLLMSIRGFLSFWQTSLGENLSHKIAYSLRNKFFNKVQTISFDFHDKWHTGELISRAISDIENVRMHLDCLEDNEGGSTDQTRAKISLKFFLSKTTRNRSTANLVKKP